MITSKKQTVVGTKILTDPETGEAIPMQLVSVEPRDFNFHKMWLRNFILATDEIRNVKMDLVFFIIDHLNGDNQLIMTQKTLAEQSGVSFATVQRTLKALLNSQPAFLLKINSGAYQINPNIIWKGSHTKRMGLIFGEEER